MDKKLLNESLLLNTVRLFKKRIADVIGYGKRKNYEKPILQGVHLFLLAEEEMGVERFEAKMLNRFFSYADNALSAAVMYLMFRVDIKVRKLSKDYSRDYLLAKCSGLSSYARDVINEEIVPVIYELITTKSYGVLDNASIDKLKEENAMLTVENTTLKNQLAEANKELIEERDITLTIGPYSVLDVLGVTKVMKVLYELHKFGKNDGLYASNVQDLLNQISTNEIPVFRKLNKGYNSSRETFLKIFDDMKAKASELYDKHNAR